MIFSWEISISTRYCTTFLISPPSKTSLSTTKSMKIHSQIIYRPLVSDCLHTFVDKYFHTFVDKYCETKIRVADTANAGTRAI